MKVRPYADFNEWKLDMERIHLNPNDRHLVEHVSSRVKASKKDLKAQVLRYLEAVQFAANPMGTGEHLAASSGKVFVVKSVQDPWWSV